MLTLKALTECEISDLYEQHMRRDFPPSELKGLSAILKMVCNGEYDVLGAYGPDGLLTAYALLYRRDEERIALLDYLAVLPEKRSCGIGSALLLELRRHYAERIDVLMIECERPKAAPDEAEARKRIRFYTQAGAVLTSVRIWLFSVEYSILALPCADHMQGRNWAQQMLSLYRRMLPNALYEQNVRLLRE